MMDPIGTRPVSNERPVAASTRAAAVSAVAAAPDQTGGAAVSLAGAAVAMASTPPVDDDRVAQIRRAVQNGTFPIFPGKIADRLIALANQWNPDDQA